jgi:hypothetical protein
MSGPFAAKELTGGQVAQAFPLIQSVAPHLTLEQWNCFVDLVTNLAGGVQHPQAGIMTIQNNRGYIQGLFSYTVEANLNHGRVLSIDNFVAFDLVDRDKAIEAMFGAMDDIAYGLGCHAIHVHLPESLTAPPRGRKGLLRVFEEADHRVETVGLCKDLRPVH